MGSVKDLILSGHPAADVIMPQTDFDFGQGAWQVKGTFSVGDLKEQIPDSEIKGKAEALTMMTADFFEYLAERHPEIPTCYIGVFDKNRNAITDLDYIMRKGEKTDIIVMKLAHVPETYSNGDLESYREAMKSGALQCCVADVESIFRNGFPLGSSTFKKIFKSVGMDDYYEKLATYDETVAGLDRIRALVSKEGLANFPGLERLLADSGLESKIPNPGFVLKKFVYDSTTKFEKAGDREITKEEEKEFSGLSGEGYGLWTQDMFPKIVKAQIDYCNERNILNIDGKAEIVAYRGMPVVTDFLCTPDENRLMIITKVKGKELAIPSNKEIQRAIYRKEGVYSAIEEAKHMALQKGDVGQWRNYFPAIIQDRKIDLQGVTDYSCDLMSYAIAEVANRALGKDMFPAKPVSIWVNDFVPYASRIVRQ